MAKNQWTDLPLHHQGDSALMREAANWCERVALQPFGRPHPAQLKVRQVNYWPATGKVTLDGGGKYPKRGLKAFKAAVMRSLNNPHCLPETEDIDLSRD